MLEFTGETERERERDRVGWPKVTQVGDDDGPEPKTESRNSQMKNANNKRKVRWKIIWENKIKKHKTRNMSCVDRREQVEVNVWRSATPDPSSAIWKTNREKPELLATGEALTKTEKLRSYLQKLEQLKVAKRRKKMSSGKINEFSLGVSRGVRRANDPQTELLITCKLSKNI